MRPKGKKKVKKPKSSSTPVNETTVPMEGDGKAKAPAVWRPGQDPIEVVPAPDSSYIFRHTQETSLSENKNGINQIINYRLFQGSI